MGGGALSSQVSRLVGKEVSKRLVKLLSSPLAREEAVVCDAKRALQMQERSTSSCNNKTLSRISKFTAFSKKFNPLPEVEEKVAHKSNKVAFTLAEVLITLGIIGIVVALTLPTVITNYQKRDIATRLKKDYSQINQVLQRINAEHGDIQIFTQSPNVFVPNYILPQYNGAKLYTTPNISNRHEKAMCYHANDPLSGANRAQYADLGKNGYISTPFMGYTTSIELPDGTCLGFNNSTTTNWANVQVFIDVNGSNKGPNILGNDLFYFSYDANTNSVKPYGYQYEETYCGTAVPNGVMHRGAGCAMKIMRDGWEIKKDYPWKGKR